MKRTVLVIPDSGPLISLSVANRLDLLFKLDMPIYVVDQLTLRKAVKSTCFGNSLREFPKRLDGRLGHGFREFATLIPETARTCVSGICYQSPRSGSSGRNLRWQGR